MKLDSALLMIIPPPRLFSATHVDSSPSSLFSLLRQRYLITININIIIHIIINITVITSLSLSLSLLSLLLILTLLLYIRSIFQRDGKESEGGFPGSARKLNLPGGIASLSLSLPLPLPSVSRRTLGRHAEKLFETFFAVQLSSLWRKKRKCTARW